MSDKQNKVLVNPATLYLNPCRYCLNEAQDKLVLQYRRLNDLPHQVVCLNCGASGPTAENEAEAVRLWNERTVEGEVTVDNVVAIYTIRALMAVCDVLVHCDMSAKVAKRELMNLVQSKGFIALLEIVEQIKSVNQKNV